MQKYFALIQVIRFCELKLLSENINIPHYDGKLLACFLEINLFTPINVKTTCAPCDSQDTVLRSWQTTQDENVRYLQNKG